MNKEQIDFYLELFGKANDESIEEAKKYENGISTIDLVAFLNKATIICGKTIMKCVEIKCIGEDGSIWNPINMHRGN